MGILNEIFQPIFGNPKNFILFSICVVVMTNIYLSYSIYQLDQENIKRNQLLNDHIKSLKDTKLQTLQSDHYFDIMKNLQIFHTNLYHAIKFKVESFEHLIQLLKNEKKK